MKTRIGNITKEVSYETQTIFLRYETERNEKGSLIKDEKGNYKAKRFPITEEEYNAGLKKEGFTMGFTDKKEYSMGGYVTSYGNIDGDKRTFSMTTVMKQNLVEFYHLKEKDMEQEFEIILREKK